jgi:hypothetical protein
MLVSTVVHVMKIKDKNEGMSSITELLLVSHGRFYVQLEKITLLG